MGRLWKISEDRANRCVWLPNQSDGVGIPRATAKRSTVRSDHTPNPTEDIPRLTHIVGIIHGIVDIAGFDGIQYRVQRRKKTLAVTCRPSNCLSIHCAVQTARAFGNNILQGLENCENIEKYESQSGLSVKNILFPD